MQQKSVLFICGSLNQTTQMTRIADELKEVANCYFTTYYADGLLRKAAERGFLDFTILGGEFKNKSVELLKNEGRAIDWRGESRYYDLVVTCSDLIVPDNTRRSKLLLVQEGMTDPENLMYKIVRSLHLPRYLASTSMTGLSDAYDVFCVASEGYRKLFINKGVNPNKIIVTGIPNYDNCLMYCNNSFPYRHHVLVATSDARETFKYENRKEFIHKVLTIADGRQVIFKLHPNENVRRATDEIYRNAKDAIVFHEGNAHEMIANSDVLVTKFSTLVYTGLALGKEVHSEFPLQELKTLLPIQNGGASAANIGEVCKRLIATNYFFPKRFPKIKNTISTN